MGVTNAITALSIAKIISILGMIWAVTEPILMQINRCKVSYD